MTPYQTPRYQQPGFAPPSAPGTPTQRQSSRSMPPPSAAISGTPRGTPQSNQGTPSYRTTPTYGGSNRPSSAAPGEPTDWKRAAEEWAKANNNKPQRNSHSSSGGGGGGWGTPRSEGRNTPR